MGPIGVNGGKETSSIAGTKIFPPSLRYWYTRPDRAPTARQARDACGPVSYTHLDVYKRQGMDAVGQVGAQATSPSFVLKWSAGPFIQDKGNPIAESSPILATLDAAGPALVVADRSGYVYAYHLADGSPVTG